MSRHGSTSQRAAFRLGAALAAALIVSQTARAQDADAILARAVTAWSNVRTIQGTFEQTIENPLTGTSATAHGTYAQERPNHLAIRFAAPAADEVVADGSNLWIYMPSSAPGQVIKRRATDRTSAPIDLTGQFLDAPKTRYAATAAGTRAVGGHAAHGVTLVPRPGVSSPFSRATVWVDDDDSLIRAFDETESSGVTRSVQLTSLRVNAPVDKATFHFAMPKGARIVDQTRE